MQNLLHIRLSEYTKQEKERDRQTNELGEGSLRQKTSTSNTKLGQNVFF